MHLSMKDSPKPKTFTFQPCLEPLLYGSGKSWGFVSRSSHLAPCKLDLARVLHDINVPKGGAELPHTSLKEKGLLAAKKFSTYTR